MDSPIFIGPLSAMMADSSDVDHSRSGAVATSNVPPTAEPASPGGSSLDLLQFWQILTDHVARLIPFDDLGVLFGQQQDFAGERGNGGTADWISPLRSTLLDQARDRWGATALTDIELQSGSEPAAEFAAEANTSQFLIAPLRIGGHLIGALVGRRRGERQFTAAECEIAEVLCKQAELTLAVLMGAESPLADPAAVPQPPAVPSGQSRPLDLLVELAGMTSDIPDLPAFLDGVTRMVQRRLGYQDVRLLLTDVAGKTLTVAARSSTGEPLPIGTTIPVESPSYQPALANGESRLLTHAGDDATDIDGWAGRARSELVIPLVVNAVPIGIIDVASTRTDAFGPRDLAILTAVGGQIAAAVHVAQLHDTTKRAALTDGLTGLANYRAFYQGLDAALARGESLSLAVFDVEGLKRVNDSGGHLAGDAFLRRFAAIIRETVRPEDLVARYGGDEFALILPGVSRQRAAAIARVIRRRIEIDSINQAGSSIRFGIASTPRDGTTAQELVACADRRLYEMRARKGKPREAVLFQTAKVYGFEP